MAVRTYVCPGEHHSISRPVHLARLAADYCACSGCPHREDLGGIELPPHPPRVETLFTSIVQKERIWRVLRSPTARQDVLRLSEALAALLWEQSPWELPLNDWDAAECRAPVAPLLAIGCDDTETARGFMGDVIRSVSRFGCRVMALGAVTRPVLELSIDHLSCTAGLWIEGGGSPMGVGFRVIDSTGRPWSAGGRLDELIAYAERGVRRPSRRAGSVRSFDPLPVYREGLARHLMGVPVIEFVAAGMSGLLQNAWETHSAHGHGRLTPLSDSLRCDSLPSPAVLKSLQEAVIRTRSAGGVVTAADGRALWIIDAREGLLTDRQLAERIALELRRELPKRELRIVVTEDTMWTDLNVPGSRLTTCSAGEQNVVETMQRVQASLGCDGAGHYWLAHPTPRCDALVALATILRGWPARAVVSAA